MFTRTLNLECFWTVLACSSEIFMLKVHQNSTLMGCKTPRSLLGIETSKASGFTDDNEGLQYTLTAYVTIFVQGVLS